MVETQRSQWADIASQYAAVYNTIRPAQQGQGSDGSGAPASASPASPAGASSASSATSAASLAADQASARALLCTWVTGRTAWFMRQLEAAVSAIDDGANLASLLAQATYAARRAGRLGADYSHLLPPLFAARARALFAERARAIAGTFRDDITGWAWAYKLGHDPNNATVSNGGSGGEGAGAAPVTGAPLSPPLSLMRFQPLADLTNGLLLAYTAIRPVVPIDAGAWLRAEAFGLLDAAFTALGDALTSQASPLAALLSASRPARRGGLLSAGGADSGGLSDDDIAAVRRYMAMSRATGDTFAPYALLVTQHLGGGRSLASSGYDNPSATLVTLEAAVAAKTLGDAQLDAAWQLAKAKAEAAAGRVAAAAQRAGLAL